MTREQAIRVIQIDAEIKALNDILLLDYVLINESLLRYMTTRIEELKTEKNKLK